MLSRKHTFTVKKSGGHYLNQIVKLLGVEQSDVIQQKYTESSTNYSYQIWKLFFLLAIAKRFAKFQETNRIEERVKHHPEEIIRQI